MPLGELIGRGRTADVHLWDEGHVIKLFHAEAPAGRAHAEADISRRAYTLGLPAPEAGDCLQIDGRWGIFFERVDGPTLLHATLRAPWRATRYARMLADVQIANHQKRCPELPSLRDSLDSGIRSAPLLDAGVKMALLEDLAEQPDDNVVCHGDVHPDNIILTARGPILIDWLTAKRGHPLADVTRTVMLLRYGTMIGASPIVEWLSRLGREIHLAVYLRHYRRMLPAAQADLDRWMPIVCAARLNEAVPRAEKQRLVKLIDRHCLRRQS